MNFSQKIQHTIKHLNRRVQLSETKSFVTFGSVVQIKSATASSYSKYNTKNGNRNGNGLVLSGMVNEYEVDSLQHFQHGCELSLSPNTEPSVKNTFILKGLTGSDQDGETIRYDEPFYIQIYESGVEQPLYIQSLIPVTSDRSDGHCALRLSSNLDIYCQFKFFPVKHMQDCTDEALVPANAPVVLSNVVLKQNLAVESHDWFKTYFGEECAVSCHTYYDSKGKEAAENIWEIVMNNNLTDIIYKNKYFDGSTTNCIEDRKISR